MEFIQSIESRNIKLAIQLMDTSNEDEINKFLISYYKSFGLRHSLDSNWFNWYYNNNPFGKCSNYILTNEKSDIVGAFGYSKFNYCLKEVSKKGVIGVNGFINPDYTGLGLYTELISETLKDIDRNYDLAFSFPHSGNIGSVKGHINSGWKFEKELYFYVKPLNPSENEFDISNVLESDLKQLSNYNFSNNPNSFVIKSYNWLNWRFHERPDKEYCVIIYKNNNQSIKGYIVYTLYKDKSGLDRCQIADYDYNDKTVFLQLLGKITQLGIKKDWSTIEFLVNEDYLDTEILCKESFIKKEESYKMFLNGDFTNFMENEKFKFEFGYFDVI